MYSKFREYVKSELKRKQMTYYKLAEKANLKESTIKYFMCGANDSRKVAEKIADTLGIKLTYSDGIYKPVTHNKEET